MPLLSDLICGTKARARLQIDDVRDVAPVQYGPHQLIIANYKKSPLPESKFRLGDNGNFISDSQDFSNYSKDFCKRSLR